MPFHAHTFIQQLKEEDKYHTRVDDNEKKEERLSPTETWQKILGKEKKTSIINWLDK